VKAITDFKKNLTSSLMTFADLTGMAFTITGSGIAIVLGRAMLAIILAALALGIFLRFSSRRKLRDAPLPVLPVWARPTSAVLSLVETALMVEATNLPVRFGQPEFEFYHWLLVAIVFVVAYTLQVSLLRRFGKLPA
jgi:hypothetical protein